jgi:hypothetical protein
MASKNTDAQRDELSERGFAAMLLLWVDMIVHA